MFYFLASLSILLFLSANGHAATYWVAKTGTNSNSCTQAQSESTPKVTITSGLSCLTAGDTLKVKAGIYAETFTNVIPSGTSWSAPVTLMANPGDAVTIQPAAGGDGVIYLVGSANAYIIIDGFIIDAVNETQGHGIVINTGAHHIRVQNSEIRNAWNQGILVSGSASHNNEFINLRVHDNGKKPTEKNLSHGLYIETDNNLIDGCEVYNNPGHGIHIYSANDWQPDNNVITDNVVHNNGRIGIGIYRGVNHRVANNIIYSESYAMKIGTTGAQIDNNTIYGNTGAGIYLPGSNSVWLRNNLVHGNGEYGILIDSSATNAVLQNNLLSNNRLENLLNKSNSTKQTGNLIGNSYDPKFVNAAAKDYRLQPGSSAIDAGVAISSLTTDCKGSSRPQGASYDIGACEYANSGLSSPINLRLELDL